MRSKLAATIAFVSVAVLLATLCSDLMAQDKGEQPSDDLMMKEHGVEYASSGKAISGVWNSTITLRICATGAPIRTFAAIYAFERGGTMHETSVGNAPNPRSSAYGIWSHLSDQNYSAAYQFFFFNTDGTFAGRSTIRKYYSVDFQGRNFTAQGTFEAVNPNGVVIGAGCITETATRFLG